MINRLVQTIALLIIFSSPSFTQTTYSGGRGLFRIFSAETIQYGSIFVNTYYLAFPRGKDSAGYGTDQSLNLGVTYGISNSLELTAQLVPYQDDQQHNWAPPGDTQIGLKWRLPVSISNFITGLRGFLRLPTGKNHNLPFEPYSSGKIAWGVMGLITVDMSQTFELPLKFHTNIGYLDHNIESILTKENTDQLLFGFGFKFPIHPFIIYTEYTGEIFINNNAVGFRDNSMRLTQGFKFVGPFKIIVDFGLDIGLSRNLDFYPEPLHEYADWKIIAGLTYHFTTSRVYGYTPEVTKIDRKKEKQLLQEIKKKREQASKDLNKVSAKLKDKPENTPE
ncbi:MAG: hypothetical protein ACE5HI_18355 [bacterium]